MSNAATTSANRVPQHTARAVNDRITHQSAANVARWAASPDGIRTRLAQLDREWDVERALETGSATLSLAGLALGSLVHRRLYLLTFAVQAFFLQHALQGWCPPLPIFRRLGFRTRDEIDHERFALEALRGDFEGLASAGPNAPDRAFAAAREPS